FYCTLLHCSLYPPFFHSFFFTATPTSEIYTLSLHDALPIYIHRLLSETLVEVCVGEIEQIKYKYNWNQQLRDYLRRIRRKTALLIATSCKLGALAGGTSQQDARKLYQYGYYIGMSYQIIDDILDFTSSEKLLGKPTASDLLQGNVTLPVLFAMKNKDFKEKLEQTLQKPEVINETEFTELLSILHKP